MGENKSRHPLKDYLLNKKGELVKELKELSTKENTTELEECKMKCIFDSLSIIEDVELICDKRGRY